MSDSLTYYLTFEFIFQAFISNILFLNFILFLKFENCYIHGKYPSMHKLYNNTKTDISYVPQRKNGTAKISFHLIDIYLHMPGPILGLGIQY